MKIPIDRQSSNPIYLQIRDYFSRLIQSEKLAAGQRLPSIRALSESLQVNKLTVIEAYRVLEVEGLIHARQGSGYFVSSIANTKFTLHSNFAPTQEVTIAQGDGSFLEQFIASLHAQHQGNIIDFSSGFPSSFRIEELQRVAKRSLSRAADLLFRYNFPQGQLLLRQQIAQLLLQQGLEVSPEELIVTHGSEQALSLALRYYLQPEDWMIVETPTYHGVLGILKNLGAKVIGIPMTATGMNLELLEQYLRSHRPKLIYTISTLHNPTGITTSQTHRQQLLALAEQYECLILEDNAYEGLNFEPVPAPIKALDRHDLVTYISTFSKTLMPGLRVGYMVVTGKHYQPLVEQKLLNDLHVSTVSQAIASEFLASGLYRRHLGRLRTTHLQSRNAMLQALEQHFPKAIAWTVPQGGLFLWTHLPDRIPIQTICREALSQNILVANGAAFFLSKGYPAMRLNYSHTLEAIEQGISILGKLLKKHSASNVKTIKIASKIKADTTNTEVDKPKFQSYY
ncbi:PLP-dependent aminotransferase family protein [Gloeocapsopsis crepidinum LEGE 06123]|uniref:PLP-dependent aminotransferase family protein n=1 Tax=Gloeocapsopsis crepidinum LEGE 06123 TaxID=588587 RepID=A0ABR9UZZ4_9CHRO|nr:PLP-dependent aminotransferase family protein [Gloeocapsopsis crepidinum]MBE9193580.1 PLP-dependent aminotransferase family protein [Gloeocapsopsis crepidinum LEGE 06123]